ncbi:MAG TPA: T6SS immunity protein Tdi1 domain-containing protein [Thermoanaerobaculia bacterium]|jgi:hypothetical protein
MQRPTWLAAAMQLLRRRRRRSFDEVTAAGDLLVPLPADFDIDAALGSWRWLVPQQVRPFAMTAFGDLFLVDGSGAVLFLDTIGGKREEVAASVEELKGTLQPAERIENWFMPDFVRELRAAGVHLSAGECYSAKHSIVLGGPFRVENWSPLSWRVHFSYMGALHEQLKDVAPGTKITDIKFPRL